MKKNRLFFMFAALFISAAVLFSCQKEEVVSEDLMLKAANSYDFYQNTNYRGTLDYDDQVCVGKNNALVFKDFETGKNIKIDIWVNDDWVEIENGAQTPPYTAYVTPAAVGTFTYRAKIWNSGFVTFNVEAIECCEPGLTYVDNEDGTYTFTFGPDETLEDALVVFTFAQGVVVSGLDELDGWEDKGQTYQKYMDLTVGECKSWTVGLEVDCGGVGQPNANLWTDFKVDDVSKKGDLENIVKECYTSPE